MLLCDAASASEGKLYILGAGWSQILEPDIPVNMALAVKIAVPWDQSNEPHEIRVALVTGDGEPVQVGDEAVQAHGKFETGRPPGLAPGTPLDAVFALSFAALTLEANSYVWELEIDGTPMARTPFRVGPVQRR